MLPTTPRRLPGVRTPPSSTPPAPLAAGLAPPARHRRSLPRAFHSLPPILLAPSIPLFAGRLTSRALPSPLLLSRPSRPSAISPPSFTDSVPSRSLRPSATSPTSSADSVPSRSLSPTILSLPLLSSSLQTPPTTPDIPTPYLLPSLPLGFPGTTLSPVLRLNLPPTPPRSPSNSHHILPFVK